MIAAYRADRARPCQEAEDIQALADRIAAEHAARSEVEAAAITRAAIRRWRQRDVAAALLRRARPTAVPQLFAQLDNSRATLIPYAEN